LWMVSQVRKRQDWSRQRRSLSGRALRVSNTVEKWIFSYRNVSCSLSEEAA
jgi:hypothetical protein